MNRGSFEVLNSFTIAQRRESYLLGKVSEGQVEAGWFVGIALNPSLDITLRIKRVESIHVVGFSEYDTLLTIDDDYDDEEMTQSRDSILTTLNVQLEEVTIYDSE